MDKKVRVIQYGVGTIGSGIAKLMLRKPALDIVGAVDSDPEKAGRDLGRVIGLERDLGITVQPDLKAAISAGGADVIVHSTRSVLGEVASQVRECVGAGMHVLSTCEELCYPFHRYPELAASLHEEAQQRGVVLMGTGVNPGFAMDKLVLTLATACQQVDKVRVLRVVDASRRRLRLQKKAGIGLTLDQFAHELEAGTIRHYGLSESAWMISDQLGMAVDRVEEAVAPIVAEMPMRSQYFQVKTGNVKGLKQVALGLRNNEEVVRLELEIYLGAAESQDSAKITGVPNLEMKVVGGIPGDIATMAIAVNSIPALFRLKPGLRIAHDVSMSFWTGDAAAMKAATA
jgi:4-hydroxy-tetrahydrodipicolinate reductase